MVLRASLVPVLALALLILAPLPAQVEVPATQPDVPLRAARNPAPPSVRLEHQFIQIEPPRPQKPALRIRRSIPATRLASATLERHDPREALVVRAGRAFLGDGRFRPEPFPRLDR